MAVDAYTTIFLFNEAKSFLPKSKIDPLNPIN